jgi:hypothetical protein
MAGKADYVYIGQYLLRYIEPSSGQQLCFNAGPDIQINKSPARVSYIGQKTFKIIRQLFPYMLCKD